MFVVITVVIIAAVLVVVMLIYITVQSCRTGRLIRGILLWWSQMLTEGRPTGARYAYIILGFVVVEVVVDVVVVVVGHVGCCDVGRGGGFEVSFG